MAQEFSWKTADGLTIYGVNWSVVEARAVVGIVHGLGEHSRRYDHWAAYFNARNIGVVGYDRRGHGRSEGKRGHTPKFSALLAEVAQLLIECERRYPDLPVVLYGHSLGGNLLLNYVFRRNPDLTAAVVSAPYIRLTTPTNPALLALARVMRYVYPSFTQNNTLDLNHLSRDPAVVAAAEADPYYHDRVSVQMALKSLEAGRYLDQYPGESAIPLLLMHGTDDHITDPRATEALARRLNGATVFKPWPGLYHELHNEPEQRQVFEYVMEWLEPYLEQADAQRKLKSV